MQGEYPSHMDIDFKQLFEELKRRRVFRVAAAYAGFAFIIFQIIDATFDTLGIPLWVGKYSIIGLILGFPISVGLGWAFDITDKGVIRTKNKPVELDSRKPFVGNISLSIVATIAIILAVWGWMKTPEIRAEGYQSIAVLPFDNYMGDASQDYFVDGMTEAIIAELARLKGLKVISRTSVMRFRGSNKSLTDIAEELGVDAIVEGSVLKAGNEVRITAQLIDGLSDEHLWANSFDRGLDQVLSLQKEVARAIAEQIKWTFNPEEEAYFQKEEAVNSEAYDLYLKGWEQRLLESPKSIKKAMTYFNAAIALDSSLYQAHAAKVVTTFLTQNGGEAQMAKAAVDAALRFAPDAAETQMAVAMYSQLFALDISGAEKAFQKVLHIRPGDAEVRREYGLFLARLGLYDEALVELEISRAYDPLSALSLRDLGMIKIRLGQGQESFELINQSLEIDPENRVCKEYLAMSLLVLNKPEEAYQLQKQLRDEGISFARGMNVSIMRAGYYKNWVPELDSLLVVFEKSDGYGKLYVNAALGNIDEAMIYFKAFVSEKDRGLILINEQPLYDPVRHRPAFKNALLDLGYPEEQPESFSDMLDRLHGPVARD